MKNFIKVIFTALSVFALCLLSGMGTVHAKAANSYTIVYHEQTSAWRYMEGDYSTDKLGKTREIYYLKELIKDGDTVTVYGAGKNQAIDLDVNLKELYLVSTSTPLVGVKSVETVYVTGNSTGVVNGDVTNAYLYSNAVFTTNGNVTNMIFINDGKTLPVPNASVTGTVSYFEKRDAEGKAIQTLYNFKKCTFVATNGNVTTAASNYSTKGTKPSDQKKETTKTKASSFSKKMADYADVFDATYYVEKYPDLKEAFGNDTKALFKHFLECGMNEGRQASAAFDPKYYMDQYADLQNAFGDDTVAYYIHYIRFGKSEGRKAVK